jgi:hypothetical protein
LPILVVIVIIPPPSSILPLSAPYCLTGVLTDPPLPKQEEQDFGLKRVYLS